MKTNKQTNKQTKNKWKGGGEYTLYSTHCMCIIIPFCNLKKLNWLKKKETAWISTCIH